MDRLEDAAVLGYVRTPADPLVLRILPARDHGTVARVDAGRVRAGPDTHDPCGYRVAECGEELIHRTEACRRLLYQLGGNIAHIHERPGQDRTDPHRAHPFDGRCRQVAIAVQEMVVYQRRSP